MSRCRPRPSSSRSRIPGCARCSSASALSSSWSRTSPGSTRRSRLTCGPPSRPRACCATTHRPRPSPMDSGSTRIDAHHHFWDPTRTSYPWMVGALLDPIRRPFGPDDLLPELTAQGISATVLVQTVSTLDETGEFLELAARWAFVRGVVGWVDLTSEAVGENLDALRNGPGGDRLVGIRHQVHDEADPDWLRRDDVRRGLAAVQARGLRYDLLVRARELPAAADTVRALPNLQF